MKGDFGSNKQLSSVHLKSLTAVLKNLQTLFLTSSCVGMVAVLPADEDAQNFIGIRWHNSLVVGRRHDHRLPAAAMRLARLPEKT
jgi:hypothetical protein